MIRENILVQEYSKRILNKLTQAGLSEEEAAQALILLDTIIYQAIAEDLTHKVEGKKKEELDMLIDEHAEPEKIIKALGVDKDQLTEIVLDKMEEYLANADKMIAKLYPTSSS